MTAEILRKKFIDFFKGKNHALIPSASLIPEHDPTVLYTTAGMHPLVPFLLGEKHPQGKRLVNVQRCLRTKDIEEVGDNEHLTFFEMMGNWSLGDYFKKEAIEWAYEFLTDEKWLRISQEKIYISIFKGDKITARDIESEKFWLKVGVKKEKIFEYGRKDNFWGPVGKTGPCGPCTEIFYDTGKPHDKKFKDQCHPNCGCGRFIEIWNLVFMEYNCNENEKFEPLKQKNVDTGMGLERILASLQKKDNVFENELFRPLLEKLRTFNYDFNENTFAERVVVDHLKSAYFILAEGITPSNLERGYILRRLIRRAVRWGRILGISAPLSHLLVDPVIKIYQEMYPEIKDKRDTIILEIKKEEERFSQTLKKGEKILNQELKTLGMGEEKKLFSGKVTFDLYQTYGYPKEMIQDDLKALNPTLLIDEEEFQKAFEVHRELSRKSLKKKFAGGLSDHSVAVAKLHTATHLLHQALRDVLGPQVYQKGSNITPERLRFDFSHLQKLTSQEIEKVEEIVNKKIKEALPVSFRTTTPEAARDLGARGLFETKYGDKVKVYKIGDYSLEICGGPHTKNTSQLGKFKIIKEEASSSGVRRLKAKLL